MCVCQPDDVNIKVREDLSDCWFFTVTCLYHICFLGVGRELGGLCVIVMSLRHHLSSECWDITCTVWVILIVICRHAICVVLQVLVFKLLPHTFNTLYITSSTFLESLPIIVVDVQYFHVDLIYFRLLSQHVLIKSEMVHVISFIFFCWKCSPQKVLGVSTNRFTHQRE